MNGYMKSFDDWGAFVNVSDFDKSVGENLHPKVFIRSIGGLPKHIHPPRN